MKLSESIPLLRENTNSDNDKGLDLSGVIALTLVLLVVALAAVWWRNRGKMQGTAGKDSSNLLGGWSRWPFGKPRCSVNVLGTAHLTGKHSLHEVEWQGKRLLIGCSSQSVQLLAEASLVNAPGEDRGA